jgi:hypothetical protein
MMNISPLMQLSASRMELPSTNAEAYYLDTAAQGSDDDPVCCPSPRLRGERGAKRRMRGRLSPNTSKVCLHAASDIHQVRIHRSSPYHPV